MYLAMLLDIYVILNNTPKNEFFRSEMAPPPLLGSFPEIHPKWYRKTSLIWLVGSLTDTGGTSGTLLNKKNEKAT